jgi:nucleoid-associated protein YgaU
MKWKKLKKQLGLPESYISVTLGFLVVIVAGLLFYNYINKNTAPENAKNGQTETRLNGNVKPTGEVSLPSIHTVAEGDTLWTIAEKYYKSGYNWVTIARENKIANPDMIETGQKLTIPKAETIKVESGAITETAVQTPKNYTVVKGDDLWNIAIKAYGDGYSWVKIAKANKLADPNLIHAGNVFVIPQ